MLSDGRLGITDMTTAERQAVAEVLESHFEPDSPEALAFAMYQLRRIYQAASRTVKPTKKSA